MSGLETKLPCTVGAVHKIGQNFFRGEGSKIEGKVLTDRYKKVLTCWRGVSNIAKKKYWRTLWTALCSPCRQSHKTLWNSWVSEVVHGVLRILFLFQIIISQRFRSFFSLLFYWLGRRFRMRLIFHIYNHLLVIFGTPKYGKQYKLIQIMINV